jgi:hypothetical protein
VAALMSDIRRRGRCNLGAHDALLAEAPAEEKLRSVVSIFVRSLHSSARIAVRLVYILEPPGVVRR